ncbi:hypothetical protein DL98DRAFT_442068 [Cadophora sp. DSE1049]|nr:hypothetical protein DL98DRAFT_442068 [Cadophora sp. DSE1049]
MQAAAELAQEEYDVGGALKHFCESLDYITIKLYISLLNYTLFNTVYNNVIIVFMAVLGIQVLALAGG